MARGSQENGEIAVAADAPPAGDRPVGVSFTLEEARALMELASSGLLAAAENGDDAPGGAGAKTAVTKLRESLEEIQKIAAVRAELEQAGFHTQHLSDEDVADLGRRIAEIPQRSR